MTNTAIVPGLQVLSGYLSEFMSHKMGAARCNDMPSELFDCLTLAQKHALHADFLKWHAEANPEDWEPMQLQCIFDFQWAGYFMDRALSAINSVEVTA